MSEVSHVSSLNQISGTPWGVKIKQEPEEENNDSGINSGSEFHASSPESESRDYIGRSPEPFIKTQICNSTTQFVKATTFMIPTTVKHFNMSSPKKACDATVNNYSQPMPHMSAYPEKMDTNPLLSLQQSLEKNGFLPSSPARSDDSNDGDGRSEGEDGEEETLDAPKYNSHGKIKKHKCKQCGYIAFTKIDFWEHTKSHIRQDRLLTCPKCPFVTEYKHHLEYHLRNHSGSKPFKCDKCSYSCVNKSMLNSHKKSHSKIYQYRCMDCSYATKYCHSLKLHLRKYNHKPAMVLNPDGTPNPLPIIDVYGTRRGPKLKSSQSRPEEANPLPNYLPQMPQEGMLPMFPFNLPMFTPLQSLFMQMHALRQPQQNLEGQNNDFQENSTGTMTPPLDEALDLRQPPSNSHGVPQMRFPNMLGMPLPPWNMPSLLNGMPPFQPKQEPMDQSLYTQQNAHRPNSTKSDESSCQMSPTSEPDMEPKNFQEESRESTETIQNELEKSIESSSSKDTLEEIESDDRKDVATPNTPKCQMTGSSRRKGKATRIPPIQSDEDAETNVQNNNNNFNITDHNLSAIKTGENNEEKSSINAVQSESEVKQIEGVNSVGSYSCKFCGIGFCDYVLYSMHMGYHNFKEPFTCHMCGEACKDKISFNLHIAQKKH